MAVEIAEKQQALLALRVFTLMHKRGLTIPQLAKRSGVALSTVQKICKGEAEHPSVWTIWALAQVLAVTIDYLVSGDAWVEDLAALDQALATK